VLLASATSPIPRGGRGPSAPHFGGPQCTPIRLIYSDRIRQSNPTWDGISRGQSMFPNRMGEARDSQFSERPYTYAHTVWPRTRKFVGMFLVSGFWWTSRVPQSNPNTRQHWTTEQPNFAVWPPEASNSYGVRQTPTGGAGPQGLKICVIPLRMLIAFFIDECWRAICFWQL